MRPYSSGAGCNVSSFAGNNGGTVLGLVSPSAAGAAGVPVVADGLHSVVISDTGAVTLAVYDNTTAVPPVCFKVTLPATGGCFSFVLDYQPKTGLVVSIGGATAASILLYWG